MTLKFRGDVRRVVTQDASRNTQFHHLSTTGMGQEAGKSAWPKTAGGYQTISGRRYGRRHAYVGFRPITEKQRTTSAIGSQNMEENRGQKDKDSKKSISSVLQSILPMASSNSVCPEVKTTSHQDGRARKQKAPSNYFQRRKSDRVVPYDNCLSNKGQSQAERVWPDSTETPTSPKVLSYINIDAYEPDSSGAEDEELTLNPCEAIHQRLDHMIRKLEDDVDSLDDPLTKASIDTEHLARVSSKDKPCRQRTVNVGQLLAGEDQNYHGVATVDGSVSCLGSLNPEGTTQSEMVVRPKIRKQTSETHLESRKRSDKKEEGRSSDSTVRNECGSAPPGFLAQTSSESEFFFDFPPMALTDFNSVTKKEDEVNAAEEDICEDLENFRKKCESSVKDERRSSSECSEGEWSASWTSDSGLEKEPCSSEGSWETLPGLDELPGCSSSQEEEVPSLSLTLEEQTPLEEGEIPWLMYNEDSGTSSDEDPDGVSQFVHPGLFILDGNNNLEDDSSVSEDLDTEWRFLDEFGDGFGMAQAISYVDHSQLLTYMALEQRLAQAMEAALAHLESLAIDVEQAHPPATEQIIDCLPQITVHVDNTEQEQCCAICCCEYVNDEIASLLPCRHMFHKLCITLWLRKSATCPVCRHVLTQDGSVTETQTPPSSHSASGGTL